MAQGMAFLTNNVAFAQILSICLYFALCAP